MKADLHIHTNFSCDGVSSPKEVINSAIKKGIDCICITDHNEIKGAIEAMKFSFDKNILIIPGIEILSTSGDVLGINIRKMIPDGLSVEETIKEIRKQGGIAVIPHLFDPFLLNLKGSEKKFLNIRPDAIEVFNASNILNSSNEKALDFSQKNNFCFTAGSDAHRKEFIGRGYIEISEKIFSEKDITEAIMNKKVKFGGKPLGYYEILKNSTNTNIGRSINYWHFWRRNDKWKKDKNLIR